ncbi:hypothetical protein WMF38_55420 [Sorangium sp. So ce118]
MRRIVARGEAAEPIELVLRALRWSCVCRMRREEIIKKFARIAVHPGQMGGAPLMPREVEELEEQLASLPPEDQTAAAVPCAFDRRGAAPTASGFTASTARPIAESAVPAGGYRRRGRSLRAASESGEKSTI